MPPDVYPANVDARNSVWNDVKGDQYNASINYQVTQQTAWGEMAFTLRSIFELVFLAFFLNIALEIVKEMSRFILNVLLILLVIVFLVRVFRLAD